MNARDALRAIYDHYGKLTPQIVVDEARPVDHELHGHFEWDNEIAGEAWRREQAHEVITGYRIVYRAADEKGRERSVRAWHAVRADTEEGNGGFAYHPADVVAQDPLMAKMVMADMEREWRQLKARYDTFREFWEMVRRDAV